jgi:hypothetical protein
MDYSNTRFDSINMWSNQLDQPNDDTRTTMLTNNLRYDQVAGFRYGASEDNTSRIFGMPNIKLGENITGTWQFTNLPYSPWLQLDGSWGTVRSTTIIESTVSWRREGWAVRGGSMYTTTNIDPGLVTRVNPITAVWTDVGYQHQGWSMSAGTLPKIVSGSADLTLPTGIDNRGRVQYTNMRVGFDNPLVGFARVGYRGNITRNVTLNAGGMISSNDAYNVKLEVKSTW